MSHSGIRTNTATVDVPDGIRVPGLAALLDAVGMCDRLNRFLPSGNHAFTSCRVTNFRFRNPTSCTIGYELSQRVTDADRVTTLNAYARAYPLPEYRTARDKALAGRWLAAANGLDVTPLDDCQAMLYWFPNDERLRGLRRIVVAKKLQRLLGAHLATYPAADWRVSDRSIRLQVMRYKPERRAVVRCRFRAHRHDATDKVEDHVYLGLYEEERVAFLWSTLSSLWSLSHRSERWAVPPPLACISDDAMIIAGELPGETLLDVLARGDERGTYFLRHTAAVVAEWHRIPMRGLASQNREEMLRQIEAAASLLRLFVPECARSVEEAERRLRLCVSQRTPGEMLFVHGDLHPGQFLVGGGKIGVLDIDRAHLGDPAEDVGNFCAQLWMGPPDGRCWDHATLSAQFQESYARALDRDIDAAGVNLWTAVALFRSALIPLGRFAAGWRGRALAIIAAVNERLG